MPMLRNLRSQPKTPQDQVLSTEVYLSQRDRGQGGREGRVICPRGLPLDGEDTLPMWHIGKWRFIKVQRETLCLDEVFKFSLGMLIR